MWYDIDFDSLQEAGSELPDVMREYLNNFHMRTNKMLDIDELWRSLKTCYADDIQYLNSNLAFSDLEQQLKSEFVMHLLNRISPKLPTITGGPNFIKASTINPFTHIEKRTLQRALDKLHIKVKEYKVTIVHDTLDSANALAKTHTFLDEIDSLVQDTYLSDYLHNHVFLTLHKTDEDKIGHYKYNFTETGRYFTAVLLRAITELTCPYTKKTEYGISLDFINKLLDRFYEAYQTSEIQKNHMEKFLFLYNTDFVFHLSLIQHIFDVYAKHIDVLSLDNLPQLYTSLNYVMNLNACPYTSIKFKLVNSDFGILFHSADSDKIEDSIFDKLNTIIQITDQLSRSFCYCVFNCCNIIDSSNTNAINALPISVYKNMQLLLLKYLISYGDFSWSYLQNSEVPKIKSFYHDIFDFYITDAFYCHRLSLNPPRDYTSELSLNRYLNYLLSRKQKTKHDLTSK